MVQVAIARQVAAGLLAAAAFLFSLQQACAADIEAGKAMSQICLPCHGPGGNSVTPGIPSISGHVAQAIGMQLYNFREGNRKNPQMSPIAEKLTNPEMNNLAAYFASEKVSPPTLKGIQHIPRLAGQQSEYVLAQLLAFKAHVRYDMDGNMTSALTVVKESDIPILADYIAGLDSR